MSLLIVGSMAFDAIETPFGKTDKIIGGAASYISLSASYFTSDIRLVSVVGGDFPHTFINNLQERGCQTEGLQIRKDEKSFFWSGRYHLDMNSRDTLTTELNVLADFDPVIPDTYQNTDYVMLGNLTPTVQRLVIERLKKRPKLIAMDTMNFWMNVAWDELMKTLALVDVLIINDEEARQLSGQYSLVKGARTIMGMGPQYVVIKKVSTVRCYFMKTAYFSLRRCHWKMFLTLPVPAIPLPVVLWVTLPKAGIIILPILNGRLYMVRQWRLFVLKNLAPSACWN